MSEANSGRGRGRAAMMARMLGTGDADREEREREMPALGRGAPLRSCPTESSTSAAPISPPRGQAAEIKPKGRGALMEKLLVKRPAEPDSEQFAPSTSSQRDVPPARKGGRGRAELLQLAVEKRQADISEDVERLTIADTPARISPPAASARKRSPVRNHGTSGRKATATANYIQLELNDSTRGIYEYEVCFNPGVDSPRARLGVVNETFREHCGRVLLFDGGSALYSPMRTKDDVLVKMCTLRSGMETELTIKYKRMKKFEDCKRILNILFKRIMNKLKLVKFGRCDYNPKKIIEITQHKLSIWPGCITAVDEYEGGIQLCCDASHRVLRDQTCLDMIQEILGMYESKGGGTANLKADIRTAFMGLSVITKYNNKVYKVDDIDFDVNPSHSFDKRDGSKITYIDYYKEQYNIDIQDKAQPLIVHRLKRKPIGKEHVDCLLHLIPEQCSPTGLTDDMRNNFKLMKDVADHTRCTPTQRQAALKEFIHGIKENEEARAILNDWGLRLPDTTVDLIARVLEPETIHFGRNKTVQEVNADWGRALSNSHVLTAVDLEYWAVLYVARDSRHVQGFMETLSKVAGGIGMRFQKPKAVIVRDDHARTYCEEIKKFHKTKCQILVIVFPSARDDRYATVKKLCNAELGIASQVINSRTLSKPQALRSIVTKIVLQMNCKIGGTLWGVKIPFAQEGVMFCGIDAYHEAAQKSKSVIALVTSLNSTSTRWTSCSAFHNRGQEISDVLTGLLKKCLEQWHKANGQFPNRIVVFRDGVGDGQLATVRDFEIPQFKRLFPRINAEYTPKFTYIIVQKRISTRIYFRQGSEFSNPPPGSVIDHTITRRDWYDFFLISQNVRQGTVSPTHYVVLDDDSNMPVDMVQKLSYKMTHMYYNWNGTVRVPAPCQYAHKLAYLIGQHVHAPARENLQDLLYFL